MSLVGTRPPTVDEWEQYELHHRSRMSIKLNFIMNIILTMSSFIFPLITFPSN